MSYLQEAGDQKKYAQEAEKLGFKLDRTSGKHEIWKHESGAQVPAPKSGSDRRGFLNFRRDLKRALTNRGALPTSVGTTKPDKVKPEAIPANKNKADKLVDAVKTTRLSSAQRRLSNKTTRSGTPTTFSDFMNRLKPKPQSLQQRMSQGYSNTLRSLPDSVKREMGNELLTRMRYKPTQGYGISNIRLADEYMPESQLGGPLPNVLYQHLPKKLPSKYSTPIITSQETGVGYSTNLKQRSYPRPGEDPVRSPLDTVDKFKPKKKQRDVETKRTGMPIVPMKPDYDAKLSATGVI